MRLELLLDGERTVDAHHRAGAEEERQVRVRGVPTCRNTERRRALEVPRDSSSRIFCGSPSQSSFHDDAIENAVRRAQIAAA